MSKLSTDNVIDALADIVGERYVLVDDDALQKYGVDRTSQWQPAPKAIVLPNSVEQVQQIVQLANQRLFAVVPSGGRTGLSGGAVAANGEVVLALDRMNQILDVNPVDQTIRCEAGVITQQLQQAADDVGLFYPVDFASSGSSQIGGNIATNAGGIKVIRYGMTRNWVLGLKVVTGCGDVLELNHGLVKNNTGYDLRHLFVGSEGTLGIICEATLSLTKPIANQQVVVMAVTDFASVVPLLELCRQKLTLTAFEFMSQQAVQAVIDHGQVSSPFSNDINGAACYVLLEHILTPESEQALAEVYQSAADYGWVTDAVISQSETQAKMLWLLREDISESLSRFRPYKNDISVRISRLAKFISDVEFLVSENYKDYRVVWYGHIGDGNLHMNIIKPEHVGEDEFADRCSKVSQKLAGIIGKYQGSISAEHGVGLLKKPYLLASRSQQEIDLMRQLKSVFDPNGLLNPGKIFDERGNGL